MKFHPLVLILLFALVLRFFFVGNYVTGDAIDTAGPARNFAETGRAAVYATTQNSNNFSYIDDGLFFNFTHPPMRFLLYSIWASILGFSNTALNLLPVIFGLLSIVFIYLIGKELYSEKVGLISALIAAVARYHIYGSLLVFGDNFLMFTAAASFYFLIVYSLKGKTADAALFILLTVLSFMTKLSSIAFVPAFFFIAWYMSDKKPSRNMILVAVSIAVSILALYFSYPITEYITGVRNSEFNFFDSYIGLLMTTGPAAANFVYGKFFYLASFAWQLTPFLAIILAMSLFKLQRDKSYWILLSWFASVFLMGFATTGQDFQRYMIVGIAPAIILTAKYIEDVSYKDRAIWIAATGVLLVALLSGLNDMMPYYSPEIIALFFAVTVLFLAFPKRKELLLGGALALSVLCLVGTSFLVNINSDVVHQMVDEVRERGYPYNELWTTRDISMYLAPPGEPSFLQRPQLDKEFIAENNVTYFAFYSIYEEQKISDVATLCNDMPFFATVNGRQVGLVCRMGYS